MSDKLQLNAISTLTITDLVVNSEGKHISVTLQRCEPTEEFKKTRELCKLPDDEDIEPLTEKNPFVLPSPGTHGLVLSLDDDIGEGRCGTVFSTSLKVLHDPTCMDSAPVESPCLPYLPPLVIKVADEQYLENLATEAFYYKELEVFQGVSIPRCYGWFKVTLDWGLTYPGGYEEYDPEDPQEHTLSVLLLERMGEPLTLKEGKKAIRDLRMVLSDLAIMNVLHGDISRSNIFQAPEAPPGFPSLVCPLHNREHKYRVIDLGLATSCDGNPNAVGRRHLAQLCGIYRPRDIKKYLRE